MVGRRAGEATGEGRFGLSTVRPNGGIFLLGFKGLVWLKWRGEDLRLGGRCRLQVAWKEGDRLGPATRQWLGLKPTYCPCAPCAQWTAGETS